MINMFYMFLKKYNFLLQYSTQIYIIGVILILEGISGLAEIIRVDFEFSTLSPIKKKDKETCLQFAMIKLIEGKVKDANQLKYYNESVKLQK